jgi:predicted flap endonuclease-1-like 5' DNA nuclease
VATLWSILDWGGPRFKLANPGTWPAQALYCVREDWAGLKRYQDELYAGVQLLADVPAEVVIDVAAAKAKGFDMKGPDDLEVVEGIGPKIAQLLRQHGITTFVQLATASPAEILAILEKGGPNFRIANPGTWPEQAVLLRAKRLDRPQGAPGPADRRPGVRRPPCGSSTVGRPRNGRPTIGGS